MKSIVDLCEPIFVYICYINRAARAGEAISYNKAKQNVEELLVKLQSDLKHGSNLWRQYNKVKMALLFFIDSMICESNISFASEWDMNRLAYEEGEMTGDKKFFDILNELYKEYSIDAEECLTFFYICLCLGFTGVYKDNTDEIKYHIDRIIARIPCLQEECKTMAYDGIYENVDKRNILKTNWLTRKRLSMLCIILFLLFIGFNMLLYLSIITPLFQIFYKVINIAC